MKTISKVSAKSDTHHRALSFSGDPRSNSHPRCGRQVEEEILQSLIRGDYCCIHASHTPAPFSFLIRVVRRLKTFGFTVVDLDLAVHEQPACPEEWYRGLLRQIDLQVSLPGELNRFWTTHHRLSPVQRLFSSIHDVLRMKCPGPIVIIVRNIDQSRGFSFSTDEFFAAVRETFNRRAVDPDLNRLRFCLVAQISAGDFIRDSTMGPFNIARRIELGDFADRKVRYGN